MGPGSILVTDAPEPVISHPEEAVVAVSSAGLCGSDLHPYLGSEPVAPGVTAGHEAVGIVSQLGSAISRFSEGDRVIVPFTTSCGSCSACVRGLSARCETSRLFGWAPPQDPAAGLDGCQAERVVVPHADTTLVAAPDVDDSHAVLLADNLPTALAAVLRARPEGSLAVMGLGSVGLCAVALAGALDVGEVVAWDPVPGRQAAAQALGAVIVDPEIGFAASAAIEAAGNQEAQRACLEMVRPGATISIISVQTAQTFAITPVEAYDANLTLTAGRASVRSVLDEHLGLLVDVGREVAGVVVDKPDLPLSRAAEAYADFVSRRFIKATFDPTT